MIKEKKEKALGLYLILLAMFLTSLIVCNMITSKFIEVDLYFKIFVLPAGILPYPITFLVTDLLSEIYGRKKANLAVFSGFVALVFTVFIVFLGQQFDAIDSSLVSNEDYNKVFGNSTRAIVASMIAYLSAQFVDVRLYHFWKRLTNGKHLWLRNNASTVLSQLLDSVLVIMVLFYGKEDFSVLSVWILNAWLFKVICALFDTPILYALVYWLRNTFSIKENEELSI